MWQQTLVCKTVLKLRVVEIITDVNKDGGCIQPSPLLYKKWSHNIPDVCCLRFYSLLIASNRNIWTSACKMTDCIQYLSFGREVFLCRTATCHQGAITNVASSIFTHIQSMEIMSDSSLSSGECHNVHAVCQPCAEVASHFLLFCSGRILKLSLFFQVFGIFELASGFLPLRNVPNCWVFGHLILTSTEQLHYQF